MAQVTQILALPLVLESLVTQEVHLDPFFQVFQVLLEVQEFLGNLWDLVVQEAQSPGYLVLLCYQVSLVGLVGREVRDHLEGPLHRLCLDYLAGQASLAGLWSGLDHL